jgi:hypothetical protein
MCYNIIMAKRGGQPNNHNALKHGFYARCLPAQDREALASIGVGLVDEIGLMRSIIRRVAEGAKDDKSKEELFRLLDSLGAAGVRLASMLRTQKVYFDESKDKAGALSDLLNDAWAEMIENGDAAAPDNWDPVEKRFR